MNGDYHSELPPTARPGATSANLAAASWLAACLAILWLASAAQDNRTSPFVAPDVALICLISVVPIGLIVARLARDLADTAAWIPGSLCWAAGVIALGLLYQRTTLIGIEATGVSGYLVRPVLAMMLIAPCVWMWTLPQATQSKFDSRRLAWLLTTWLLAVALPSTYVIARCRQDVTHCRELLEQSRLGEASAVAHRLLRLSPGSQVQGQPIARIVADIDRSVRRLQVAVGVSPQASATDDELLLRARRLAMLGQTDAALQALAAVRIPSPATYLLSATIHENLGHWRQGLDDYSRALKIWNAQPNSPEREAGRIQATTGIAYCLRKQGRYWAAEQAYRQLLALSPNADTHYLLAQFYEDTQQTVLARQHAQRAMALEPDRFELPGRRLINKLTTMHFGCFRMLSKPTED